MIPKIDLVCVDLATSFNAQGKHLGHLDQFGNSPELKSRVSILDKNYKTIATLGDDVARIEADKGFAIRRDETKWQDGKFVHVQSISRERNTDRRAAPNIEDSRVLCHGEFFLEENTDPMIRALRAAFYKRMRERSTPKRSIGFIPSVECTVAL